MLNSYSKELNSESDIQSLDKEMDFIGGRFFDSEIPADKQYLLKYFTTELQEQFVRFYLMFGHARRFVDHTGHYCSDRWIKLLKARYKYLEKSLQEAKDKGDFEKVAEIKSGKFKPGRQKSPTTIK